MRCKFIKNYGENQLYLRELTKIFKMKIIITNDDGFEAKGLHSLVEIMRPYGELTIISPKKPQSGMSMAVTMGHKPIAVKKLSETEGESWWYLDGTPASCVKFGIDNILFPERPDLVVSGINHGNNAATAAIYSGTIGAAMEGAVNGIPSIGVSLDSYDPDADFSGIKALLPSLIDQILEKKSGAKGQFFNINFPNLPAEQIKGVKLCHMGMAHWEKEYQDYNEFLERTGKKPSDEALEYLRNLEEGEEVYVMAGDFTSDEGNRYPADHLLLEEGYITITPHNIDNSDHAEKDRLCDITL